MRITKRHDVENSVAFVHNTNKADAAKATSGAGLPTNTVSPATGAARESQA